MGWVYYRDFTKPQREVLLALADHGKEDGTHIHPSIETLAWKLQTDRRHIQRTLRELEALGVLVPVAYATGGRGHATEYEMHLEAAPMKKTPPPGERMKKIYDMLNSGLQTALSGDDTDTKGGVQTTVSPENRAKGGVQTTVSPKMSKGRTFEHQKGGLLNTKGGVQTAPTNITVSNNRQEETAHARGNENTPLDENVVPEAEAEAEAEADPPLLREPPPTFGDFAAIYRRRPGKGYATPYTEIREAYYETYGVTPEQAAEMRTEHYA